MPSNHPVYAFQPPVYASLHPCTPCICLPALLCTPPYVHPMCTLLCTPLYVHTLCTPPYVHSVYTTLCTPRIYHQGIPHPVHPWVYQPPSVHPWCTSSLPCLARCSATKPWAQAGRKTWAGRHKSVKSVKSVESGMLLRAEVLRSSRTINTTIG